MQGKRCSRPATPHVLKIELLSIGSQRYCKAHNLGSPAIDYSRIIASDEVGREISAAYMSAPILDEAAFPAYKLFRAETARQFEFLTRSRKRGGLGMQVEVSIEDPYPDASAMTRDIAENNRLKIYATGGVDNRHPWLTDEENNMFRAVHDAFGHASIGRGFDRDGEEAAWLKQSTMYSWLAQKALTTETRANHNAMIFHYRGLRFPEQKAVLLPYELCDPTSVPLRQRGKVDRHDR